jgi:MFS transporter, ACS family, D-galactonate transporter
MSTIASGTDGSGTVVVSTLEESMSSTQTSSCLVGLIGKGIGQSKSPAIHEHEGDAMGIRCSYRLIDLNELGVGVEALPSLLQNAEREGFAGLNITHPCKQAVIPLLDELSVDARAIGAVNTIRFRNGRRYGYNTDSTGFAASFVRGLPEVNRSRVVQIGAGGAGAATAYAMLGLGAERLFIFDTAAERARNLADNLGRHFDRTRVFATDDLHAAIKASTGIVHATPVGMRDHPGMPLAEALLRRDLWVADIVYFPMDTELLKAARRLGCRTLDGGGMAVMQAAGAFEIFTGLKPDTERMLTHFANLSADQACPHTFKGSRSVTTSGAQTSARSRARFLVLALIATGTLINYLDRTVLGIAAPLLSKELSINAALMGVVFSAFSWTYAAAQIPGGIFLDRFGTRLTYMLSVSGWSIFTMLHGAVGNLFSLLGMRFGLGITEAPCFPANSRVVATWFPQSERAFATSVYTVGEYIGLAFLSPILFWILQEFGWRVLFLVTGSLGMFFAVGWWNLYREPYESKRVNTAELEYISSGGGIVSKATSRAPFDWRQAGRLIRHRRMWGICIGQFASNSTLVFFLTWFPTYLASERQMAWIKIGFFAILPFLAASVGVLSGGWWSDWLLRTGRGASIARKLPIITGLLLASTIVAANYVDSDIAVVAIMSVAFFAQGMAALGWTLVSDIAPVGMLGVTGGIFNFAANLAGIVTPLVIGAIVAASGSFAGALVFVGLLALVGALSYIFVVDDVRRIEL